jgi:hypothetical protein
MPASKVRIRLLTIVLVSVTAGLVLAGIYFSTPAQNLPSFFPGHETDGLRHQDEHGIVVMGLAILVLIAAWFTTATDQPKDSA